MKTENIHIKVTESQKLQIANDADKLGLTISAFLLMLYMQYKHGIQSTKVAEAAD